MTHVADEPPPQEGDGDMWMEVIEDMHNRRATGIARYGTPLQAFNGRDALVDLYQELLDAVVYTKQKLIESGALNPLADVESLAEAMRRAEQTDHGLFSHEHTHLERAALIMGFLLCGHPSSVSDRKCNLLRGHPQWRPERFHRYDGP